MSRHDHEISRRRLMETTARSLLGVSILPAVNSWAAAQAPGGKTRRLIYLFMHGAMSHIDTFDPKPGTKAQGPTKTIKTKIPGIQFGEHLPKLAGMANRLAVVRSLNTATGAHGPGQYLMRTSYKQIATTRHPGLGPWLQKTMGRIHPDLPPSVQVGGGEGPGYLGAKFAPVPIGDPAKGLQNTRQPAYLLDGQFSQRMKLAGKFDQTFRSRASTSEVLGYDDLYREAISLLNSKDLAAFDITKEPKEKQDKYGPSRFGKGCLLASRLIQHGVRYVEVTHRSWDHHRELASTNNLPTKCRDLDIGLSTLLTDLNSKGLLDETLVVVATEFGRKPNINQNAGRDHHPAAFSCVLAGAGIRGGQVFGATDEEAFHVADKDVTPQDFNATIATALGLQVDKQIHSPDGRPFSIADDGVPIKELLA